MQTSAKRWSFRHIGLLALIVAVMLGMTVIPGNAQTSMGTILGTLTDATGAVVGNTTVQLINAGTSTKLTAKTNDSGYYQFVEVPVGTYKIVVQKEGFKQLSRAGIVLQTEARIQVDLALTVGASTETVEVTASSPLIEADTVSLGTVVDTRETNELPLNGRNPMNLTALVTSVIPLGQTSGSPTGVNPIAWGNYQIGGGMAGQNNVFIDGAPNWGIYDHNIEIIPTQDSIAEFRVETNNLTAEYGRLAGGAISFTTKSGTKDIHGGAWEFIRNKVFNANTYFANSGGPGGTPLDRPAFTQNQYGFNLGGPVFIPHVYDGRKKTFWFFNWEGFNLRSGETYTTNVPTAGVLPDSTGTSDLTGWFAIDGTTAVYDPLTTCTTVGGCAGQTVTNVSGTASAAAPAAYGARLPIGWDNGAPLGQFTTAQGFSNSINPTSIGYLKYVFPTPQQPLLLQKNYTYNASGGGNNYQYVTKIDHDLNDKNHIMGRYTYWKNLSLPVDVFKPKNSGVCGNGACTEEYHVHNFVLDDTATLSAKTILDVRLSYSRYSYDRLPANTAFDVTQIGWPAIYNSAAIVEFPGTPSFSVPDFDPGTYGLFSGQGSDSRIFDRQDTYRLAGSLTRFFGNHTVKIGAEYNLAGFNYAQTNTSSGIWYWNTGFTQDNQVTTQAQGNDIASYLLGYPSSGSANYDAKSASRQTYPAVFAMDDWRATSKLTVHVGIRWENNIPYIERHNWISSFDPTQNNAVLAGVGITVPGNITMTDSPQRTSRSAMDSDTRQWSPRAGVSYRIAPNTVINAGYGIFWLPNDVTLAQNPGWDGDTAGSTPYTTALNSAGNPGTSAALGSTGCGTPSGICSISTPYPLTNPADATSAFIIMPAFRNTTTGSNTVNNQRTPIDLNGTSVFQYQLNTLGNGPTEIFPKNPYAYAEQWNFGVQQQLGKSTAVDVAYGGARGIHLPFGWLGENQMPDSYLKQADGLKTAIPNPYEPYVPLGNGLTAATMDQGQAYRPYPEYTGISEPADVGDSWYNAFELKVTKRFTQGASINVAYTFAKFESTTDTLNSWLESVSGVQDNNNLPGEKSLSSSDAPQRLVIAYVYDVPIGRGKALLPNISRAADYVVGGWGLQGMTVLMKGFPLGMGMNTNTNYGAGQRPDVVAGCAKNISGAATKKLNGWFNPACFVSPGTYTYGNESRLDNSLEAPGMANWDLSVVKKFAIDKDGKLNLQFRAEFFNLFNRVQFGTPNTSIGNSSQGAIYSQLNLPRIAQFALRVTF